MKEKKSGISHNSDKREKYFTLKKFLITGQEMLVEMRGSFHTRRGKAGLGLFLAGILWGIWAIEESDLTEFFSLFNSLLWCTMGIVMFLNQENHKLMYLLPISRKEFAAAQIQRMAWVFLIILAMQTAYLGCMRMEADELWRIFWWKIIPVSGTLSIAQITAAKPAKNSGQTGDKIYQLSYGAMIAVFSMGLLNFVIEADSWNLWYGILPVLNYGANLWAVFYLYRKIGSADVYYDEL
ncbi:MAG: hypothetical protein HFH41_07590 [Lachnospiraceae bacterium]|nr:hypothetical protein [Lachnospiraceae bacterium]